MFLYRRGQVNIKKAKAVFSVVICAGFAAVLLTVSVYVFKIYNINCSYNKRYAVHGQVGLRKFPYPYKAALAICSDIDNTETLEEFLEIQKFLNTNTMTSLGRGLGLEIGNSFLMYAPDTCCISFFDEDTKTAEVITKLVKNTYL